MGATAAAATTGVNTPRKIIKAAQAVKGFALTRKKRKKEGSQSMYIINVPGGSFFELIRILRIFQSQRLYRYFKQKVASLWKLLSVHTS